MIKNKLKSLDTRSIYSCQIPMKSDTYVINRYLEHPIYRYDVYALINNDKVEALCVVRPVRINDTLVLRFVDFIGHNQSFFKLHSCLLGILKVYEAEYIDIYSHGIPLEILSKTGFINRQMVPDLIIPNHFEPFERENIEVSFAFKNLNFDKPVKLFKGDSDTDRPSIIPHYTK